MPQSPNKRDEILDVAERMIRDAGYNAFSTRLIAKEIGIKAASVHYYFPSKSELGVAVAERYTRRFLDGLGDPHHYQGDFGAAVAEYVDAFRVAFGSEQRLCLCAVLGAEVGSLPSDVGRATRRFFEANIEWLRAANGEVDAAERENQAMHVIAALEGAMIVSRSLADSSAFERVAQMLTRLYPRERRVTTSAG